MEPFNNSPLFRILMKGVILHEEEARDDER